MPGSNRSRENIKKWNASEITVDPDAQNPTLLIGKNEAMTSRDFIRLGFSQAWF
jgi:hypothetical protein